MIISVVTPSYNQGRYLVDTIESVLSQEGDFHLDYIVIDGGSSDDSVDIIRRYDTLLQEGGWQLRCRGIRYRWVSEKDGGQTDALMKGFRLAQGEILAWLNSDDTYFPGALAKAAGAFRKEPDAGVAYGRTRFIDAGGADVGCYPTEPFAFERLAESNFICQPSAFFTREALDAAGGLDTSLHFSMDYDLWIRIAATRRFVYLPEYLSTYRLHDTSKTMSPADAQANHREALETVRRHFHRAPLNRVYGYCRSRVAGALPGPLAGSMALVVLFSLPVAVASYLFYNRGIRLRDFRLLNRETFGNLFREWVELHTRKAG